MTCTAAVGTDSTSEPTFTWSGPSGSIDQTNEINIIQGPSETSAINHASVIVFAPLQASHEGDYTCTVMFGDSTNSDTEEVTVKGKFGKLFKRNI